MKEKQPFQRLEVTREELLEMFKEKWSANQATYEFIESTLPETPSRGV